MPCFHPLKGYRSKTLSPGGRRSVVFNPKDGFIDRPVTLGCGQCVGCRLERSRQWAIRCVHEASLHANNCFITLTYNEQNLPPGGCLNLRHFQLFMKRLRKRHGAQIRFFHCGEYGENFGRPHYHACIFNHDFHDKIPFKEENGIPTYTSADLTDLWPLGFSLVGDVTFQSAAYTARYIMKKITGSPAGAHYELVDEHGEIHQRPPEYTTMSRRPGIGSTWLKKYTPDIYPDDFVVINGKKMKPPKYYDRQFEIEAPDEYRKIRARRLKSGRKNQHENTPARMKIRETVQNARLEQLPRKIK